MVERLLAKESSSPGQGESGVNNGRRTEGISEPWAPEAQVQLPPMVALGVQVMLLLQVCRMQELRSRGGFHWDFQRPGRAAPQSQGCPSPWELTQLPPCARDARHGAAGFGACAAKCGSCFHQFKPFYP